MTEQLAGIWNADQLKAMPTVQQKALLDTVYLLFMDRMQWDLYAIKLGVGNHRNKIPETLRPSALPASTRDGVRDRRVLNNAVIENNKLWATRMDTDFIVLEHMKMEARKERSEEGLRPAPCGSVSLVDVDLDPEAHRLSRQHRHSYGLRVDNPEKEFSEDLNDFWMRVVTKYKAYRAMSAEERAAHRSSLSSSEIAGSPDAKSQADETNTAAETLPEPSPQESMNPQVTMGSRGDALGAETSEQREAKYKQYMSHIKRASSRAKSTERNNAAIKQPMEIDDIRSTINKMLSDTTNIAGSPGPEPERDAVEPIPAPATSGKGKMAESASAASEPDKMAESLPATSESDKMTDSAPVAHESGKVAECGCAIDEETSQLDPGHWEKVAASFAPVWTEVPFTLTDEFEEQFAQFYARVLLALYDSPIDADADVYDQRDGDDKPDGDDKSDGHGKPDDDDKLNGHGKPENDGMSDDAGKPDGDGKVNGASDGSGGSGTNETREVSEKVEITNHHEANTTPANSKHLNGDKAIGLPHHHKSHNTNGFSNFHEIFGNFTNENATITPSIDLDKHVDTSTTPSNKSSPQKMTPEAQAAAFRSLHSTLRSTNLSPTKSGVEIKSPKTSASLEAVKIKQGVALRSARFVESGEGKKYDVEFLLKFKELVGCEPRLDWNKI